MYNSDTNIVLRVDSRRLGSKFDIKRFTEYSVDMDLETDADGFDFIIKNPDGIYTGICSRYDDIYIIINGQNTMRGIIDSVKYSWNDKDSYIRVVGRDRASILIDNDSIPGEYTLAKPTTWLANKCNEYGIKYNILSDSPAAVQKLIIGTGETEMSIINNLLMDSRKRTWFIYDTLYCGDWSTNVSPSYTFVRGIQSISGTPIKSLSLDEDGTSSRSEVQIYGSVNDGAEKILGVARNEWMIYNNIRKRMVKRSYNNDSSSKYSSNALRDVRESFKDNIVLELDIRTDGTPILPNRTARVIDSITKINSTFFIKSVSYKKNMSSGSITTIKMIPGDTTFEVMWSGDGLTGTPKMSLDELVKSRKG